MGAGTGAPELAPLVKGKKKGPMRGDKGAKKRHNGCHCSAVEGEAKVDWTETIAIPSGKRAKPTLLCLLFPNAKRMRVDPAGPNAWLIRLI